MTFNLFAKCCCFDQGDNFEDTTWLPPSISKAVEYRTKVIFKGSLAPLNSVKVCNSPDLGLGVSMYFQFVRSMTICMAVMTLLSFPCLIFAWFGSKIAENDFDSIGFYHFSLGNIGYNEASLSYVAQSQCATQTTFMNVNETCIHLPANIELPLSVVGSILTLCEILQIVVFFITVLHISKRAATAKQELTRLITSVTDYAVMVTGIPKDTSPEQVIAHFSNLYPLDKPDWLKRPALAGARPVQSVSPNSGTDADTIVVCVHAFTHFMNTLFFSRIVSSLVNLCFNIFNDFVAASYLNLQCLLLLLLLLLFVVSARTPMLLSTSTLGSQNAQFFAKLEYFCPLSKTKKTSPENCIEPAPR